MWLTGSQNAYQRLGHTYTGGQDRGMIATSSLIQRMYVYICSLHYVAYPITRLVVSKPTQIIALSWFRTGSNQFFPVMYYMLHCATTSLIVTCYFLIVYANMHHRSPQDSRICGPMYSITSCTVGIMHCAYLLRLRVTFSHTALTYRLFRGKWHFTVPDQWLCFKEGNQLEIHNSHRYQHTHIHISHP